MTLKVSSGGQKVKIFGALSIFLGMFIFFGSAYLGFTNKFWLVLSGFLFVGGFIVFIMGRFMD